MRHTTRDMRHALRGVREQRGEALLERLPASAPEYDSDFISEAAREAVAAHVAAAKAPVLTPAPACHAHRIS